METFITFKLFIFFFRDAQTITGSRTWTNPTCLLNDNDSFALLAAPELFDYFLVLIVHSVIMMRFCQADNCLSVCWTASVNENPNLNPRNGVCLIP